MTNKNKYISWIKWYFFISILLMTSCQGSKESNKGEKVPSKGFIEGRNIDVEYYQSIKSNVARLRGLLSGKFVQYVVPPSFLVKDSLENINGIMELKDPSKAISLTEFTQNKYITWLVNEQKDSIIMYSIPVGNPNKDGYWLYHYQILTSLPNEPVYEVFEQFTERNRDSITSVYYSVPEDFNVPLEQLLANYKVEFEIIEFKKLEERAGETGLYLRQNPLFFKDEGPLVSYDPNSTVHQKNIYEIYPEYYYYHTITYEDSTLAGIIGAQSTRFEKEGMFK